MRQTRFPVLASALASLALAVPASGQQRVALAKPDAESKESFTRVTAVRELPSGKVLVVDQQDKVVQLVDLASGTMTKVGREGQGPGEYGLPIGLYGLPSGETLVYDIAGRRFMTISPDGKPGALLEMPRPPASQGGGGAGPVVAFGLTNPRGVDAQGRIYFEASPFTPSGATADSVPILRWDRVKPVFDTVGYLTVPKGSATASGGGGRFTVQFGGGKIWSPAEAWDVSGDGRVARVRPSPYRVIWFAGGKAVPGPVQPYSPIKVTQADKDLYTENQKKQPPMQIRIGGGGGGGTGGASTNFTPPPPEFEETMPPFVGRGSVLATPDGEVWVLRTRPASDNVPSYDVFDKTGALVKKVMLNPKSRVVGFGKGTVYVARVDDDDLQYLQRFSRP